MVTEYCVNPERYLNLLRLYCNVLDIEKKTWSIDFFIFSYKYNTVKDYTFWKTTKLMFESINQKQWIHFITYLGRYKKRRKHFSVLNVRLVCHKALIQEINVITFWSAKNCMNVWLLLMSWSVNSKCGT